MSLLSRTGVAMNTFTDKAVPTGMLNSNDMEFQINKNILCGPYVGQHKIFLLGIHTPNE